MTEHKKNGPVYRVAAQLKTYSYSFESEKRILFISQKLCLKTMRHKAIAGPSICAFLGITEYDWRLIHSAYTGQILRFAIGTAIKYDPT